MKKYYELKLLLYYISSQGSAFALLLFHIPIVFTSFSVFPLLCSLCPLCWDMKCLPTIKLWFIAWKFWISASEFNFILAVFKRWIFFYLSFSDFYLSFYAFSCFSCFSCVFSWDSLWWVWFFEVIAVISDSFFSLTCCYFSFVLMFKI